MAKEKLKGDGQDGPDAADQQSLPGRRDGEKERQDPEIKAKEADADQGGQLVGGQIAHEAGVSGCSQAAVENGQKDQADPGEQIDGGDFHKLSPSCDGFRVAGRMALYSRGVNLLNRDT